MTRNRASRLPAGVEIPVGDAVKQRPGLSRLLDRVGNVPGMVGQDVRETLLDLERRGWDSLCDGTGDSFYGELMTDDALMVLANGQVMDRDAVVESLRDAPPWRTYEISDLRFVDAGDDAAAIVYGGRAYRAAQEPAFVGLMSSVYVRREGAWRLALYQQTPSADASS